MDTKFVKRKFDYIDDKNYEKKNIKKKIYNNNQENSSDVDIINLLSKHRIKSEEEEDYGHYVQTDFYGYFQYNQNNQNNSNNELINFRSNKRF